MARWGVSYTYKLNGECSGIYYSPMFRGTLLPQIVVY